MEHPSEFPEEAAVEGAGVTQHSGKKMGELLIDKKLITQDDLDRALSFQRDKGGRLGEILIKEGLVTAEDILSIIGLQSNLPIVELKNQKIDPSVLALVPEEIARKSTVIPLALEEDTLVLAMAFPDDIQTPRDISTRSGKRVRVVLALPVDILNSIDLYYHAGQEIEKSLGQLADVAGVKENTDELTEETPISQTLELILSQAVKVRASDIHIEPLEDSLRIRFRIDGILNEMYSLPIPVHAALISRIKILSQMNIAEKRRPQDGQMSVKIGKKDIDIRVATMLTTHGERIAMRILDKSMSPLSLQEVGFMPETLLKFRRILKSPFGTVLVCGPTGSGKTTTLYAALNTFDRHTQNIITIEDPVEYEFKYINQTQINAKAGITFASGLRTILRNDPDIVLVGEIRDRETAEIATQASLTGRLVLATIHSNDAVSIIFRLIDLGIEPFLLAPTLVASLSQRMVRRICPYCKTAVKPSAEDEAAFAKEILDVPTELYSGKGCNMCANTGYRGRIALTELMVMSENLRRLVIKGCSLDELKTTAMMEDMQTMQTDGMLKAQMGITTVREVLRTAFTAF